MMDTSMSSMSMMKGRSIVKTTSFSGSVQDTQHRINESWTVVFDINTLFLVFFRVIVNLSPILTGQLTVVIYKAQMAISSFFIVSK